MPTTLSLGSPIAVLVIVSMFLYWIISAIVFFILHRFGNRSKTSNAKSISDKSYDLQYYERGLSRNKIGAAAAGV